MISKKGAMELSINTIVVVVIGITILVLGLVFVKGMFDKLGGQVDILFDDTENIVSTIASHDQKISVQQSVDVIRGEQEYFTVWIVNFDDTDKTFRVEVEPAASNPFGDGVKVDFANGESDIETGGEVGFVAAVAASSKAVHSKSGGYKVTVFADGVEYASSGFFVRVDR